jgi:hypothetical protein
MNGEVLVVGELPNFQEQSGKFPNFQISKFAKWAIVLLSNLEILV